MSECAVYLREGDTLIVFALDRLSHSTVDVLTQINGLSARGVRLAIISYGFDTATPAGKLAPTMFTAFAEFERGIRKERPREGIARARQDGGKYLGRKPKLTLEQQAELNRRFVAGGNRSALAREFGIDHVTVHRYASSAT